MVLEHGYEKQIRKKLYFLLEIIHFEFFKIISFENQSCFFRLWLFFNHILVGFVRKQPSFFHVHSHRLCVASCLSPVQAMSECCFCNLKMHFFAICGICVHAAFPVCVWVVFPAHKAFLPTITCLFWHRLYVFLAAKPSALELFFDPCFFL